MLTPRFSLDQNDNFLILNVECPFSKGRDLDFHMDGNEFRFSLNPYYLRLRFSHEIIEDGTEHAEWHIDDGSICIWLPKKVKQQHFADLDLISKLLATKRQPEVKPSSTPLIQEINESDREDKLEANEQGMNANLNSVDFDWEIEQTVPGSVDELLGKTAKYGFDNCYSGIVERMPSEYKYELFGDSFDFENIENRTRFRHQQETEQFDIEHYLYDFVDDEENIKTILEKDFWFTKRNLVETFDKSLQLGEKSDSAISFSSREQQELANLKLKLSYFISNRQLVLSGLVELLLAFVYSYKIFDGEYDNPEVAWNLVVLCPMMCNLESNQDVQTVVENFLTRSLCYPLYRNWNLSNSCLQDVQSMLQLGRGPVLKALAWMKIALERDESRSIFCKIFVNDYCGWIQSDSFDNKELQMLSAFLDRLLPTITKQSFSFMPLEEIEQLLQE